MTIKDFKTGQTVYALTKIKGKTTSHVIKRYTVLSVGRKYVKAALEGAECPDSFYINKDTDDYLTENITWREPAKLFLTETAANDDVEKDMLRSWLKNATEWRRISDYTLEQLRAVREILEEPVRTTDEGIKEEGIEFDITQQELSTSDENFFFDHEKNAFEAVYEYDFDPDKYFGTTSSLPDGEIYLTFVTEWNMDTDDVRMYYWGEFERCDGNDELEKVLTEKEKEFFRKLMDQFCVDKYGVSIFKLHRPLTDLERIIFPHENGEEDTEEEADEEMSEEMDEEADGDQDDDRNEYGEIEYHIRIEMRIRLPEIGTMCKSDIMPYKQTVLTNIRTAFNADTADHLFDIEDCSIDGDTVYLGINTFIMSEDDTDAQLFCEERMRPITLELEKFGYYVNDVSYDVEYVG